MIECYRRHRRSFAYLQDIRRDLSDGGRNRDNREESKLRYWGLIEEDPARREDGGRAGWWRITEAGEEWLFNRSFIPKYAVVWHNAVYGYAGDPVSIVDVLGTRFNYRELMEGI